MQHRDPANSESPSTPNPRLATLSRWRGFLAVALFLELYLCAILVPAYTFDGGTLAFLFVLYAAFTAFLYATAEFAWRAGRIFGLAASGATALCVTAQLRLDAELLSAEGLGLTAEQAAERDALKGKLQASPREECRLAPSSAAL